MQNTVRVDTLLYGDKPSDIINKAKSEYADRLGHVLCLGDGEGRQSRALSEVVLLSLP